MGWERVRKRVVERREQLGFTLREMGSKLGVSWSGLGHFEVGRNNISFEVLEKLAAVLGMEVILELVPPGEARAYRFAQLVSGMTPEDVERMERVAKVMSAVHSDTLKDALTIAIEASAGIRPPTKNPFAAA